MKRVRRVVKAGRTILVTEYDLPARKKRAGEPRAPKENPSPISKVKANYRAACRNLTALMNENFRPGDFLVTFKYFRCRRPESFDEAKQYFTKTVLPKIRDRMRRQGQTLSRYVYVCEHGKKGALHHHLVIQSTDVRIIRDCWDASLGSVDFKPLYADGDYSRLAEYLLKQYNPDDVCYNPHPGRRWSMAKGMPKHSGIYKKILKGAWDRKEPYVPKGYVMRADSYYVAENPYTHRPYRCYICLAPPPAASSAARRERRDRHVHSPKH